MKGKGDMGIFCFRKKNSFKFFLKIFLLLGLFLIFSSSGYGESPDFPDTQGTAKLITPSLTPITGRAGWNDEDWFKFTITETKWIVVCLQETGGGEVFMQLQGQSGNFLDVYEGENHTSSGYIYESTFYDDEGFIKVRLRPGTYYIRLYYAPRYDAADYRLYLLDTKETPDFADSSGSSTSLGDITSTQYSGIVDGEKGYNSIDSGDDNEHDWLTFNITSPGQITIDVKELGGEQFLVFMDNTQNGDNIGNIINGNLGYYGSKVAVREDTNYDKRAYIKAKLSPGTFYLYIYNQTSGRSDYRSLASLDISFTKDQTDWYQDADNDGYGCSPGSSSVCQVITQNDKPDGYVSNSLDCDDSDATIKPGASEACNGKDDNCNGQVDEGLPQTMFYRDADGDGYGDPNQFISSCLQPDGFVSDNTDCNDNNPGINPGAFDSCSTSIDENCSGSNDDCSNEPEFCANLADIPLETQVEQPSPLLMILVDDSGSMEWDVLCPENSGKFAGNGYVSSVKRNWKSQWNGYNGIYYDPNLDYVPWPDSSIKSYSNADTDYPLNHPNSSSSRGLNSTFYTFGSKKIVYAHYYAWSSSAGKPYLINITGNNGSYSVVYYRVSQQWSGNANYAYISGLTKVSGSSVPDDVKVKRSASEERQNFANWYQYYRTRQLTALSALAQVIDNSEKIKIGLHTLNHGNGINMIAPRLAKDYKKAILKDLYKIDADGGTPLRTALKAVGEMYSNESNSPYEGADKGGFCQQAYTIVMTDGYYNGSSPGVGNADGDNNTLFDGSPYSDPYSNTLADVAMHYYERDLNSNLSNNVTTNARDQNTGQHMVTYTISFGLKGHYDPAAYDCPDNCPTWLGNSNNSSKIDDLWHAAVNGRGEFLAANNAQQLASTLEKLLNAIKDRAGSGASVSLNTQKLEAGTRIYQGSYDSSKWAGDLKAYSVNSSSGDVNSTPLWSASEKLGQRYTNNHNFYQTRKIYSFNTETNTGIELKYASLSSSQQISFGSDAVKIINYIKGDRSNEIKKGGGFRDRDSILGDIVHSSPILYKNKLFVGANDGMFHCFDAATGEEIFAYVPGFLFKYSRLKSLADPDYIHKYFVDNTPFITELKNGKSMLVSGLGKGGKGYFALDISSVVDSSDSTSFISSNVKWEYPDSTTPSDEVKNMGYSFSQATILKTNDESIGEAVFFGNGYDSENGRAALFIVNTNGDLLKMLDTKVGGTGSSDCNGLSSPSYVDTNFDGKVDIVYAGDMQGNIWKFDVSDTDYNNWTISYKNSSGDPKPLFQAKDASGNKQKITSKIAIARHCSANKKGYIVVFGTGSFNSVSDFDDSKIQSIYGIWDWEEEWKSLKQQTGSSIDISTKYYGAFESSGLKRTLSNISGNSYFSTPPVELTLIEQSVKSLSSNGNWELTSDYSINWFSPKDYHRVKNDGKSYGGGAHVGWYINLVKSGERVVADPTIRGGNVIIVTLDPSRSPCQTGGNSYLRILNVCNGGSPGIIFDTDDDGSFDDENLNQIPGLSGPPNVLKLDDIYYRPAILSNDPFDLLYLGNKNPTKIQAEDMGFIYWKIAE